MRLQVIRIDFLTFRSVYRFLRLESGRIWIGSQEAVGDARVLYGTARCTRGEFAFSLLVRIELMLIGDIVLTG